MDSHLLPGLVLALFRVVAALAALALLVVVLVAARFAPLRVRPVHVDAPLRSVVVLPFDDLLEAPYRVLDLHVLPLRAGERLGHEERLREKALDLARALDGLLVLVRELVDT